MKKLIAGLVLSGLLIVIGLVGRVHAKSFRSYTAAQMGQCSYYETEDISATDTNTSFSFVRTTRGIYIENTGSTHEVYINLNGSPAVADADLSMVLEPYDNRSIAGFTTKTIGIICATAETTTVRIEGCF